MKDLSPSPYSDADVLALCDDLRIERDKAPALSKGLRVAAHHWRRNTTAPKEAIRPKALADELTAFIYALDKAKASLENLTDAQWEMMRHGSAMFNSDPYISRIGQRADADDPSVQTKTVQLVGRGNETELPLRDIGAALDVLANAAHLGATPLDPSKRGPRPDFPLEAWTRAMLILCTSTLKTPFTRDEESGKPISAAACFCVNAYAVLSPTTKSTLVLTAMKDAISEQGKSLEELNVKLD